MTYCHSPWTNIDISPQGQISPCCKFRHNHYQTKIPNINDITIEEYVNSPLLQQVKSDFNKGIWPKGCERCKIEEDNGIKSKRILDKERWLEHYKSYDESKGFITASIAFGNTCNLACVTCGPDASSKWHQEYIKLHKKDIKPNHFYKDGFVENFLNTAKNIIHLDIPGGEPLLSGVIQQKEMLQKYIDNGRSNEITLHYTTNGTLFPDDEFFDLWNKFKSVEIQLSIDGIDNRFEYIRYPANWSVVLENIQKYKTKNVTITVATTVSAYNIAYLDELVSCLHTIGLGMPWLGRLHYPKYMRPTVWRDDAKKFIIDRLNNSNYDFTSFIKLLESEDDQESFEDFRYHLLRQDSYRKNSFGQTFPEMLTYIKN